MESSVLEWRKMWSLTTNYIRSTIANAQTQALMHEELADYVKNSVRLV